MNKEKKSSYISLVGAPNTGKSTLLNNIIGSKLSIISPKVQTTRNIINGICIYDHAQLIFVDTPGIFTPKGKLENAIVKVAWKGVINAEQIALLIDSKKGICRITQDIIDELIKKKLKINIILNKIDLINKYILLDMIDKLKSYPIVNEIFMVSAINGDGVDYLKKYFANSAEIDGWPYDEDEITDLPKKFFASEIVREQLFFNLQQELPYNVAVECEKWEERVKSAKINIVIYTTKNNHKKIIIGKSGEMIKKIGQNARRELEKFFGYKIHLFLYVKARENWMDNPELIPA